MFLALGIGAKATEYHFVLTSDAAPDTPVTVRVPNLAAVRTEQVQMVQDVASGIGSLLADGAEGPRLKALTVGDVRASAAVIAAARASVARTNPNLPVSAQWTLAADALNAMNWPALAAGALREAEKASPAAALTPGAQRLAATVAASSGETRVFEHAPTRVLTSQETSQLADTNLLVGASADRAAQLAGQLRGVPALKVFGLSLDGDAQKAAGNHDAARRALEEAATIRQTPSVTRRLGTIRPARPQAVVVQPATNGR
jgi:hypothetical protein